MPRTQKLSGTKSFVKGLITASTGLMYPDNAVTNTDNVIYDFLGQATRREGFNLEVGNTPKAATWKSSAISSFLWHNVLGDGSLNIYVVQIGTLLYFYPLSTTGEALSAQLVSVPLDITAMASSTLQSVLIAPTTSPTVGHIGNLSNLAASFDSVTVQASGSCSALGAASNVITGYVGQNYTGNPQKIGSATLYPSSDQGFGQCTETAQLTVNPFTVGTFDQAVTSLTVNLRAKTTLPASSSDGTLLGFQTFSSDQNAPVTIISNDIVSTWNYVWFEISIVFDPSAPAGPWAILSFSSLLYTAEAKFFTFTTTNPVSASNLPGAECQYTNGLGYLFVTHPFCFPFAVTYTAGSPATYTATAITIIVRDFDGLDDSNQDLTINTRPNTGLGTDAKHLYNLYNQGWTAGTITTWQTNFASTYPSNCDVWWQMKNASGVFTPGTFATGASAVDFGSTAAPKGRFLYDAFYVDRGVNTPAGAGGLGVTTSNNNRPSTVAFFAGRVFYSGVNAPNYANSIWFSQTLSPTNSNLTKAFGHCYEENDPTSETLFDLLDTDGGVIKIADCGQIYKLFSMQNRLIVFASNGIWEVAGTKGTAGLGFVATDYTINRISNVRQLSGTSFVDVLGVPYWWTNEGVYMIKIDQNTGGLQAENITYGTINPTFENILRNSKAYARGYYSPTEYTVQWLYRSTAPVTTPDDNYKFDSVLVLNTITNAFYTFSISTGNVNVASIVVVDTGGETDVSPTNVTFCYKYFVTYISSNMQTINIADMFDAQYLDWFDFDGTGQEYTSTFTSGYKLDGSALMKFQPGYINVYSTNFDDPTSLLLHFDSDFTDSTENANVVTTTGVPVISTAQSKFGGASVSLVDSDTLSIADSSLFDPNEDFTIDFWYYPTDIVTPNLTLLHKGSGSFPAYRIYHLSNALYFFASSNGTANDVSNAIGLVNIVANTWYHIAVTHKDNVLRVFVNGALLYTSGVSTLWDSGDPIVMSGLGFIDEFRYSRLARWTTAFTSPTAAYVPYSSPFKIQSTWEYTTNRNSGRWSPVQVIPNDISSDTYSINRVRTRGRGRVMQFKITSVNNSPFTIIGWVNLEGVNQVP